MELCCAERVVAMADARALERRASAGDADAAWELGLMCAQSPGRVTGNTPQRPVHYLERKQDLKRSKITEKLPKAHGNNAT